MKIHDLLIIRHYKEKMEKWNNRYDNLLNMRMNGEIEKERYDEKREQIA